MQFRHLSLALLVTVVPSMVVGAASPLAGFKKTDAVITKNGKTVLTYGEFEAFIDDLKKADPNIEFYLKMDPSIKAQLLDAKERQIIIDTVAQAMGAANDPEYKKEYEQGEKALREMLSQKFFVKKHVQEVTDADAQRYYQENKDTDSMLVAVPAGVQAKGVKFASQAEAEKFAAQVKAENNDITKAATPAKHAVQDFGSVTKMSMNVDPAVKAKILETAKFPAVDVVKAGDKEFWVVVSLRKQETQYRSLDQVKDAIKQRLNSKRIEEMFQTKVPQFEKEHKIEVNKKFADALKQEAEVMKGEAEGFIQQLMQQQEAAQAEQKAQAPKQPAKQAAKQTAPSAQRAG